MRFHQFFISVFFVSRPPVFGSRTLSFSQKRTPVVDSVHGSRMSASGGRPPVADTVKFYRYIFIDMILFISRSLIGESDELTN